jgi:hypothetical protein
MVLFTLTLEITQDTSTPDEGYYGFRLTEIPLTKSFASHSIPILAGFVLRKRAVVRRRKSFHPERPFSSGTAFFIRTKPATVVPLTLAWIISSSK